MAGGLDGAPLDSDLQELVPHAEAMLPRAYAPHSHFQVGAALRTAAGAIVTGANVENASYGLSVCAERAGIFGAVATEGAGMRLDSIVVVTSGTGLASPCGACRQVMAEFGDDELRVAFRTGSGLRQFRLGDLLMLSFRLPPPP